MGTLNAPGYSFRYIGGDATYVIIPSIVMEADCLLPYEGEAFFPASLSEPMSCIVGAFNASYHIPPGTYVHEMGIRKGGKMALLAGVGPMGLGAIDYAIHQEENRSCWLSPILMKTVLPGLPVYLLRNLLKKKG